MLYFVCNDVLISQHGANAAERNKEDAIPLYLAGAQTLRKAFSFVDRDGNGAVTVAEIKKAIESSGQKVDRVAVEDTMNTYDADRSGVFNFNEFVQMKLRK